MNSDERKKKGKLRARDRILLYTLRTSLGLSLQNERMERVRLGKGSR